MYPVIILLILMLCATALLADESKASGTSGQPKDPVKQAHEFFATHCNNKTWELLGLSEFTPEIKDSLLQNAFASAYHWSYVGTGVNFQRGEWLIARVYTVLENKQEALSHALHCLDLTAKYVSEMQDFDRAYSYEAAARAYALNQNKEDFIKFYTLAVDAGEHITVKEDKDLFFQDLNDGNWFGMQRP